LSEIAKPLQDNEVEFKDEDDCSAAEIKKAVVGFTPTQKVSWPGDASPEREPERSPQEADGRTRGEHAKTNRVLDGREEAEKARQEDHRHESVVGDSHRGSFEAKCASGFTRQAGKHTDYSGPLTRGGRLKIFPDSSSEVEIQHDLEILQDIAKRVLHGRNATIFQKLVIEPLADGRRHPPVEDVAAQFNVTPKRAYKIRDKCWDKVLREHKRRQQHESQAVGSRVCSICGKPDSSNEMCPRGNDGACDRRSYGFRWGLFDTIGFHRDISPFFSEEMGGSRKEETEKWENTYGVNRPYGPKSNAK
jgi:hypothetical protein